MTPSLNLDSRWPIGIRDKLKDMLHNSRLFHKEDGEAGAKRTKSSVFQKGRVLIVVQHSD